MNKSEQAPLLDTPTIMATSQKDSLKLLNLEPYLFIVMADGSGKHYPLHKQCNTFGRSGDVDIVIEDSKISRKHGAFVIYPDAIFLQDLQSTNGCYVDGKRIERHEIISTSRIHVGNTVMKIEYKNASEVESERALYKAATTDELTNLANRRAFMSRAQEEMSYCKRHNDNFALLMCDVDYFKKVNDNFGHPAGDQVLKDLAKILSTEKREEDIVARYGGEEFIIMMRKTDADEALNWAERLRSKVESYPFVFQGRDIPTTLSIGVCCITGAGENADNLNVVIQEADNALYQAKKNGRNRVQVC